MYALVALLLVDGYLLMQTPTRRVPVQTKVEGSYVVYGTMKCGWTRKQLDHFKSKNISHTFVDCDKNPEKCQGMKAFPVVQMPSGEKKLGFQQL